MKFALATQDDCALLAELNHQLIRDEGHRNPMSVRDWLAGEYRAVIFKAEGDVVAYALFCEQVEEIYLRQFFVVRHQRRRGFGGQAVEILRSAIWPTNKRLTVQVLVANEGAVGFWRAMGYADYALTLEIVPPHA